MGVYCGIAPHNKPPFLLFRWQKRVHMRLLYQIQRLNPCIAYFFVRADSVQVSADLNVPPTKKRSEFQTRSVCEHECMGFIQLQSFPQLGVHRPLSFGC